VSEPLITIIFEVSLVGPTRPGKLNALSGDPRPWPMKRGASLEDARMHKGKRPRLLSSDITQDPRRRPNEEVANNELLLEPVLPLQATEVKPSTSVQELNGMPSTIMFDRGGNSTRPGSRILQSTRKAQADL